MESPSSKTVQLAISLLTFRNIVLAVSAFVILQCFYQVVYYRFFSPLAKFPGPFWAAATRMWVASVDITGKPKPRECEDLHKRYGPVVRITPTMLFVSPSTALPTIYRRHANKAKTYITGSFGEPENLFNVQDWKQHAKMRKLLAGSVSISGRSFVVATDSIEVQLLQCQEDGAALRHPDPGMDRSN